MTSQPKSSSQQFQTSRAYSFLKNSNTLVLSTVDANSVPSTAVVYFVVDDNLRVSFITKTSTRKYQNIKANSKVSFCIYDEAMRLTLQAEGVASEVADVDEQLRVMDQLGKVQTDRSHSWFPPVAQIKNGNIVIISISIKNIKLSDFGKFIGKSGEDVVEQINL